MTLTEETGPPSFAGHESFTLRYGWLPKAVRAVEADPAVFRRDDALVSLGVGKNMVRSIRHWGFAAGILQQPPSRGSGRAPHVEPTALGRLLFGKDGWDPFLEDLATVWLLHWQLVSRPGGPTTWYWAFNELTDAEFTKQRLINGLEQLIERRGWKPVSEDSLSRDVDCFPRTYLGSRPSRTLVLEETLDCPLVELKVMQELDIGRVYAFNRGEHRTLPIQVVAYAVIEFWARTAPHRDTLPFHHLAYSPGSPGRVFKLSENALTDYVEALTPPTGGSISFDVTAGLQQLYRRKIVKPLDVLGSMYSPRAKGRA